MERTIYVLVDVEKLAFVQRAAGHADTYHIADRADRERLTPGMYAKLGFINGAGPARAERLWVKIIGRAPEDNGYIGVLDSDPLTFDEDDLRCGDSVWFGPEHVMEWTAQQP